MKQIIQSLKTGKTYLEDLPVPFPGPGQVLIKTTRSLYPFRLKADLGNAVEPFKNKDAENLAVKLSYLLGAPEERESIGQKARLRVETHYSWDHITDEFERLYQSLIG